MSVLKDVFDELYKMFVADARLTVAVLLLVALVAAGVEWLPAVGHVLMGVVLLAGCVGIVVMATTLHALKVRGNRR